VKLLLDTHVIIWFLNGDVRLSARARDAILSRANQKFASIVTVWEVAIKLSLQKLSFRGGVTGFLHLLEDNDFTLLPLDGRHLVELEKLPWLHRDPFDRLLVAAAFVENMSLITHDQNMRLYPVPCFW
jgi:PIN domain nuclease of toxin-antitoxin system